MGNLKNFQAFYIQLSYFCSFFYCRYLNWHWRSDLIRCSVSSWLWNIRCAEIDWLALRSRSVVDTFSLLTPLPICHGHALASVNTAMFAHRLLLSFIMRTKSPAFMGWMGTVAVWCLPAKPQKLGTVDRFLPREHVQSVGLLNVQFLGLTPGL